MSKTAVKTSKDAHKSAAELGTTYQVARLFSYSETILVFVIRTENWSKPLEAR